MGSPGRILRGSRRTLRRAQGERTNAGDTERGTAHAELVEACGVAQRSVLGSTVFLNGRYVAGERAAVSVFDRGLLYGDGLFETMRSYRGVVFQLDEHIERLRASSGVLALPLPAFDWRARCHELLRRNGLVERDAWVRLMVTRGTSAPRLLPAERSQATTIILSGALPNRRRTSPATAVLLPFAPESFIAEHKSLNYLLGVLGKAFAARHGADEGLYVGANGILREGTTSSLFLVRDGSLYTVPADGILPGITRQCVLGLATTAAIRTVERRLRPADLLESDEAFLTSSLAEITPLVRVDERPIGGGRPGPVTRQLQRLYRTAVGRYRRRSRT